MLSTQENNSFFFSNKWWKTTQTVLSVSLLLLTIFIPLTTTAAINEQINYQGKLTDSAGDAVADTTYSIVFRLYTVSSGGTNIWTETQSVTTTNGLFSVMLGSGTSLSNIDFNQTLYLGVNVNADGEMSPRKIIGAVPAAFYANDSDTLDGLTASDFLYATTTNATGTISTLNTNTLNVFNSTTSNATTTNLFVSGNTTIGSLTGVLKATAGVVSASLVSLTSDISGVLGIANGGTATSTQVTNGVNYFDGTRITSGTSLVYNGTNFGIGTSTPGSILSVGGVANFKSATSTFYSTGGINLSSGCFAIGSTCIGGGGGSTSPAGSNGQIQFNNAGAFGAASDFTWDSTGKVLHLASTTSYSNLLVRYINSGPNSGLTPDYSADTYISVGLNDDTASTIGKNTYLSIGGNGGSNPVGNTDGDGAVGGVVYLAGGGDGNSDSDGYGVGGAGGTINMVYGGFGSTNEPTKGADGRVNIGRTDGNKNAILYLYGGMRIDTASTSAFSINSGATNYFKVNSVNGNVGIGTSTPGTALSIGTGTDYVNVLGTATSTFSKGIELKSGCFSVNGTCIGGGSSVNLSSATGILAIANGGTATSTQVTNGVNYFDGTRITSGTSLVYNGTNFGIGTSTPGSLLSIGGVANFKSATSTFYSTGGINLSSGCFAIGSTCIGGGGGGGSVAGSSGQIQFNNAGAFGASANLFWDNSRDILSLATSTSAKGTLFATFINGADPISGSYFLSATTTYIASHSYRNTAAGAVVHVARGSNDDGGGSTAGTGGTVNLSDGGNGLEIDGANGGVGGTVNMVRGGFNDSVVYANDGTVNIGNSAGLKNASLYVYGTTNVMFKNAATTNGVCHSGTDLDTTDSTNSYQLVACSAAPGDLAEFYPTENNVEVGHIVAPSLDEYEYQAEGSDPYTGEIKSLGNQKVSIMKKATMESGFIGIVSTGPFQTFGKDILKSRGKDKTKPIALVGRVPLKVNGEGGQIKPGDRITISSEAGVGKKATETGMTVGVALESFSGNTLGDEGNIMVFVNLSHAKISNSITLGDVDGFWTLDDLGNLKSLSNIDLNNQSIINIKSLSSSSGKWSLDEGGLFKVVGIEAEKLTVKNGVTTEDKTTGEFYCIYVDEGELITAQGRCEDLFEEELPELPDDTATTTASTTPPVDETPQGGGGGDEPAPEEETPIEEIPVVETPTEEPVVTPDPLPPTPESEAPPEPEESPEPEPTPDPEPAPEEPSAPDASSEPAI